MAVVVGVGVEVEEARGLKRMQDERSRRVSLPRAVQLSG